MVTFNASDQGPFASALESLALLEADIWMGQEHRVICEQQLARMEARAKAAGYKATLCPALPTSAGSTSAGVGIGGRSCIGMGNAEPRFGSVIPHVLWPGHLVCAHFDAVLKGGLLCFSPYLVHGLGLHGVNLEILRAIGIAACNWGGPFLVGGDFNLEPGELISSGWLGLIGAQVVAPSCNTCTIGAGSCIDFFLEEKRHSQP